MTKSPPNRKRFTRIASLLLAASIAAPMLIGNMTAYAADADDTPTQVSSFQWKYPKNPSFEEINQYAAEHPFDVDLPDSYDIIPDIANKEINTRIGTDTSALVDAKGKADRDRLAGSLTQETLDNALNATNFMRVHAGLSHRSYILNPALSGTGFGAAPDSLSAVLWPSRKQPIETFQARDTWTMQYPESNPYQGNPWSYFINTNDVSVDTNTLKVTLTCDGKPTDVLAFNDLTATEKSEKGSPSSLNASPVCGRGI